MHNIHVSHVNPVDDFRLVKWYEWQSRGEMLNEGQSVIFTSSGDFLP